MNKFVAPLVALYVICGIVAFGHAFATTDRVVNEFSGETYRASGTQKIIIGIAAGVAWPLYLSVKAWEAARPGGEHD